MSKQPVKFKIDWNACINCGACIAVCPQDAGFVSAFDTIAVNTPCDIACMACEEMCPVSTISHKKVLFNNIPVKKLHKKDRNGQLSKRFKEYTT